MPPKSAAARRQGSIKSFDSFRIAKHVPKAPFKNEKPALTKRNSSVTSQQTLVPDSSEELEPVEIDLSSEPSTVAPAPAKVVRPDLDESDEAYSQLATLIRSAKKTPPLHANSGTIETILRDFDLTGKYGPSVGLTRLQRFNRAKKMKLNPPEVIGQILETQQAHDKTEYRNEVRESPAMSRTD